jgi:flagellar biosynthesis protein FliP
MLKLIANATAGLALMLTASVGAPAWSADNAAGHKAKCSYAKHKHAKRSTPAAKPQPARGIMLVEHRKQDVQILSFGP